jgi:hypothetical protein
MCDMVNSRSADIFNCSFESSKTGKIEEFFDENGLRGTREFELTLSALTMTGPQAARTVC